MRKIALILTSLLLFVSTAYAQSTPSPLPRLQIEGNHFINPEGKAVTLKGVSLCSLEWHKPLEQIEAVTSSQDKWNVNVIRMPVQVKEWNRVGAASYLRDYLDPAVKLCTKNNVYCIIDWHDISEWNKPENIKALETFWKLVAPRYASNKNIIYEIYNEPTEPSARTMENWLAWRDQAQQWVDMIRKVAPKTILLIGNPHWDQMPAFAAQEPFKGTGLAYVLHVYPNWKKEQWDELFGNAADTIPLFITEWGWSSQPSAWWGIKGDRESYGEPLKAYLKTKPYVNWTAWSYDSLCGPAMLGADKDMGAFVKEWLAEDGS